jgi:uncharacterized protein (DUF2267 family)
MRPLKLFLRKGHEPRSGGRNFHGQAVAERRDKKSSVNRDRHSPVRRTMNFERYAAEGNHFINMVADELNTDRNTAARITKAVLHAVRDRLPANDAVEFSQGLPMAIKGIFFDQYDLSKAPVPIRHAKEFLQYVRYKDGNSADKDFLDMEFIEDSIAAVFRVLERTMDYGQVEQIKRMMNDDMAYLFY